VRPRAQLLSQEIDVTESSIWIHDVVWRHSVVINPCSEAKIRLVGERMGLRPGEHVLDMGAGQAGPAVLFASNFGSRVTAVERHPPFVEVGRHRARRERVDHLVEYVVADGATVTLEPERYDAAVCFGAAWILGDYTGTARALGAAVRPGGHVAIGDIYLKIPGERPGAWPSNYPLALTLGDLVDAMRALGLVPVTVVTASEDDWNEYVSEKLLSVADWLDENPSHPDRAAVTETSRGFTADEAQWRSLGWGIVVGRKTG
jgi:2-polyprenyl-3-methyl-5-hydroxy-6-metoxy-1,4-benzoquinol methylase